VTHLSNKYHVLSQTHLSNEDHMLATELFLQFSDQTSLDLLVGAQLGHRHEDDDGLLALNIDLLEHDAHILPL
jgi:hypothetical protein